MGLLDDMENKAVASALGGSSNPLAGSLLQMINNHPGGLSGLELAAKAGISPDVAGSSLAAMLPSLIDKLTPNGQMPDHSNLLQMGMSVLQSLGKTGTNG